MARLLPEMTFDDIEAENGSRAEAVTYEALRTLSNDFTILYSVKWLEARHDSPPAPGESDFVIMHPDLGMSVLEVKGGALEIGGGPDAWYTRTAGGLQRITSPVSQAMRASNFFKRKLRSLPGWPDDSIDVGYGIVLPDTTTRAPALGLDAPGEIIIYGDQLAAIDERLPRLLDYWSRGGGAPMDSTVIERVIEALAPKRSLSFSLGARIVQDDQQFGRLTTEQFGLIRTLSGIPRALITGGAGTGKTALAFEKARQLQAQGLDTLFVCFNRPLAEELATRASTLPRPFNVKTFHEFCVSMANEAGLEVPDLSDSHPREFYDETLPELLLSALDLLPGHRYDAVIADEAQDFAPDWWAAIELATRNQDDGILYVFMDDYQDIYRRAPSPPAGLPRFPLTRNLRNTRHIHDAALAHYAGEPLESAGPAGSPVEYVHAETDRALVREASRVIHRLCVDEGVAPENIAILSGRSARQSAFAQLDSVGAFRLEHSYAPRMGMVSHDSVHRFKGLERSVVILTEFSPEADPRLVYVGLTRAKSHVIVIGARDTLEMFQRGLQRN